jgi:hypothetical protein
MCSTSPTTSGSGSLKPATRMGTDKQISSSSLTPSAPSPTDGSLRRTSSGNFYFSLKSSRADGLTFDQRLAPLNSMVEKKVQRKGLQQDLRDNGRDEQNIRSLFFLRTSRSCQPLGIATCPNCRNLRVLEKPTDAS